MKPGLKLRWKLPRVSTEEEEALKQCRGRAVRTTRKYLRQEQRRPPLAKLSKQLGGIGKKDNRESVDEGSPDAAYTRRQPPGSMAPQNTTQYLMGNVYADMTTDDIFSASVDSLSPTAHAPQDPDHDGCLAFQQRDFEEAFDLHWQPE
ncbi:hypothetical protein VZT92_016401 [Zoarces viviparus]|uniref:Uncharacterized protein n=1 Tax=Zoarces viviparus TaxID=48416 RepID=A0AAW1ETK4_ZOAVI